MNIEVTSKQMQMAAMALHTVTMVFWKETAFPLLQVLEQECCLPGD